ncbi:hypothetical protein [Fulvitalea axinellae]
MKPKNVRGKEDLYLSSIRYQYAFLKSVDLGKGWSWNPVKGSMTFIFYYDRYLDDLKDGFPDGYYLLRNDQTLQLGFETGFTKRFEKGEVLKGISFYGNANQDLVYLLNTFRSFKQEQGHLISLGLGVIFHFEL